MYNKGVQIPYNACTGVRHPFSFNENGWKFSQLESSIEKLLKQDTFLKLSFMAMTTVCQIHLRRFSSIITAYNFLVTYLKI